MVLTGIGRERYQGLPNGAAVSDVEDQAAAVLKRHPLHLATLCGGLPPPISQSFPDSRATFFASRQIGRPPQLVNAPCNRRPLSPFALGHSIHPGSLAMKYLPIVAAALVASLGACSIKEERTVQQPAPATVVATPSPGTVVYTDPAPATATTTVYAR
jgi:hypothetical protein